MHSLKVIRRNNDAAIKHDQRIKQQAIDAGHVFAGIPYAIDYCTKDGAVVTLLTADTDLVESIDAAKQWLLVDRDDVSAVSCRRVA